VQIVTIMTALIPFFYRRKTCKNPLANGRKSPNFSAFFVDLDC